MLSRKRSADTTVSENMAGDDTNNGAAAADGVADSNGASPKLKKTKLSEECDNPDSTSHSDSKDMNSAATSVPLPDTKDTPDTDTDTDTGNGPGAGGALLAAPSTAAPPTTQPPPPPPPPPPAAAAAAAADAVPLSLSPDPPSAVVHFRNVTPEVPTEELHALCAHYGTVDQLIRLHQRNQCLVQFSSISEAIAMVNYYVSMQSNPIVHGRKIYPRFSRHQQLSQNSRESGKQTSVVLAKCRFMYDPNMYGIQFCADLVHDAFAAYGTVEKIVIPSKSTSYQALIKYSSVEAAANARKQLNGGRAFVGTQPYVLEMGVDMNVSKLDDLIVKAQTHRTRDYRQMPYSGYNAYAVAAANAAAAAVAPHQQPQHAMYGAPQHPPQYQHHQQQPMQYDYGYGVPGAVSAPGAGAAGPGAPGPSAAAGYYGYGQYDQSAYAHNAATPPVAPAASAAAVAAAAAAAAAVSSKANAGPPTHPQ
jgi:RNA recognition motif/RNA recognition motif. (a.k.a. RRM, RBD, or RNP domain)